MSRETGTIALCLAGGQDAAPAIGAIQRPWLTRGAARELAARTVASLNAMGLGRGDRVAIVLPNGPEMAAAFVAVAHGATVAPLNPAYTQTDFLFYLSDLRARALIAAPGDGPLARAAAAELGLPVIDLVGRDGAAGDFDLRGPPGHAGILAKGGLAEPEDIALILHTSGTTARPKIVPLTHANIMNSARNIGASLALDEADVCLNIMPLFHIHGLIAAVLASLTAGAAVCCSAGLNGFRFYGWLAEVRPTWFTAVPTMHQTLLELAPRFAAQIAAARSGPRPPRFIRSSSASLSPATMRALEDTFGVPVVEAYGMTEAAHQMAANPLPPRARHPGSVGVAAGPEIAILDETGRHLPTGEVGEVAIRGPNVMMGYESNPAANAAAFHDGWFRTGDLGVLDAEGYLRLTGRLKEIVNRGGEKISPAEVEAALLEHPAVRQAVVFALPDRLMGEVAGAAIVAREGMTPDETEMRDFLAARLTAFKVPKQIVTVNELPVGATGKIQRIGMAERLGLVS